MNEPLENFSLTVKTGDKASETFVIDSDFQTIARSVGDEVKFELPGGLYSVKVKTGDTITEKHVTLRGDQTKTFDPPPFETAAPLPNTIETSKAQSELALAHCNKKEADVVIGEGGRLFLFQSIYQGKANLEAAVKKQDPTVGLTLKNDKDELLVDFNKLTNGSPGFDPVPWAACVVSLNPGTYYLCLETAAQDFFKQSLVVSPNWQTLVFLQPRDYGFDERDIRADLTSTSIFFARHGGGEDVRFSWDSLESGDFRLTELLKKGLCEGRNVVASEVWQDLCAGKIENPMLGIYAAHSVLRELKSKPEQPENVTGMADVQKVVQQLQHLLGKQHPDVEALALAAGMEVEFVFSAFPMLARSWDYVIEASIHKPDIVPTNSLAYRNSNSIRSRDLWLIWGAPLNANLEQNLADQLKVFLQQTLALNVEAGNDIRPKAAPSEGFWGLVDKLKESKLFKRIFGLKEVIQSIDLPLDKELIDEIILRVGMPAKKIDALLTNIGREELMNKVYQPEVQESRIVENDPQKNKWGGEPERNDRKLSATVDPAGAPGLYTVNLLVESTNESSPLTGEVKFYLHDTFLNPDPVVPVVDGKARLTLSHVWGAFTVGAQTDEDTVSLELDLAELTSAPVEFKLK